ncbi:MAG: PTS sugar transporter subunit IIC [Bacteroidales bacterium]|nr:PTS sugar transporter subunit IIC [Bacteroidales bacterium]
MNIRSFLKRKQIEITWKSYLLDALSAMALGLFASLLIGVILDTIGDKCGLEWLRVLAGYAKGVTGSAIGVAIAYALHAPALVLFSAVAVGMAGNALGGPVGALVAVVISTELGKAVSKETKVDILVTPFVVIASGVLLAQFVGPWIQAFMEAFGRFVMHATEMRPFAMGIVVSVSIGMALTLPISSAAICIAIGLSGLAGGAATAGCCAQMIGFAVMSFRENGWSGIVSQGIGTSMIQMSNIIRNPWVWLPPTLAGAVAGPVATCVFHLSNVAIGSGMGTCGLVGPIGIVSAMPEGGATMWFGLITVCFIMPAILTPLFAWPMRRTGLIKDGDLKIEG